MFRALTETALGSLNEYLQHGFKTNKASYLKKYLKIHNDFLFPLTQSHNFQALEEEGL